MFRVRPLVVSAGGITFILLACTLCPDSIDNWLLTRPASPETSSGQPRQWGPHKDEECSAEGAASDEYKLHVEDEVLADLKERLVRWRAPGAPMEHDDGWSYGINSNFMAKLVDEWRDDYDWRKYEAQVNTVGLSETVVDGLIIRMHHIQRGSGKKAILLLHGWPGSIWEFNKFIQLMQNQTTLDEYGIVCPSLPGYGFSGAPNIEGYNNVAMAGTMKRLMKKLGYERYVIQGGDWGSMVAQSMAYLDPSPLIGLHLNFFPCTFSPGHFLREEFQIRFLEDEGSRERARKSRDIAAILSQSGYLHQQATKPETIGHALSDSPAGLCAWMSEKFQSWSDPSLLLGDKFNTQDILTNCMIYWATNSITSSMRLYKEQYRSDEAMAVYNLRVTLPVALSLFPHEIFSPADAQIRTRFRNIVLFRKHETGGHFAALENPDLLLGDLVEFIKRVQ